MSSKRESNIVQQEKNINPQNNANSNANINNIQNASQSIQGGGSSIMTDKVNENPDQQNTLDPNKKSLSTLHQSTAYPNSHWVILESILERNGLATKPTTFSLEVLGIYSLPDFWIKMDQSGAVDNWGYQVKISEAKCLNGKLNMRELTDEEKSQAENKKKPAPKIDKKNPEAVKPKKKD